MARIFHLARHDRGPCEWPPCCMNLGEVAMERDYIQRAGALTDEEIIDKTTPHSYCEREASRAGADRAAQLLVRWHHEWWNGRGYPDALQREEIPLAARILRARLTHMQHVPTCVLSSSAKQRRRLEIC